MDEHNKQNTGGEQKKLELVSYFDNDASFVFAYKKTEKLASAVYMVTNLFPENEPMRLGLRKKVSDLLSFTLSYKDVRTSNMSDFVYEAQSRVLEIVSMLEVSMLGGLVSNMNFSLLKTEFSNLSYTFLAGISAQKESSRGLISSSFFSVPEPKNDSVFVSRNNFTNNVGSYAGRHTMSANPVKDTHVEVPKDEFKRSNRQNIILSLIKKKKEVTIKDIALVIKDCSEKTIQRELISFMSAGVLKRTGERRWSKYSLA